MTDSGVGSGSLLDFFRRAGEAVISTPVGDLAARKSAAAADPAPGPAVSKRVMQPGGSRFDRAAIEI
jgi:hypothetical protein